MRKNRYRWLMIAGILLVTLAANGQNYLKNGGFEEVSAGVPKGWVVMDWKPAGERRPVSVIVESDGAPEGQNFARIVSDTDFGNLVLYQDINRPAPGNYRLTLTCRPDEGSTAHASAVGAKGGENVVYERTEKVSPSGGWIEQTLDFSLPEGINYLRILMRSTCGASFDDVSLAFLGAGDFSAANEPSTLSAVTQKKNNNTVEYSTEFDRKRKAQMAPEVLAWEQVLEENLGSHYLPRYKRNKERGKETAWDYVRDDPALPRVLLIGDSISHGYTLPVRHALAGKANVHRAPANCSSTSRGLEKLDVWLGDGAWDLIHFNFGIHDRKNDPASYAQRLEKIVLQLQQTGARLVFATSTPLSEDSEEYPAGACVALNAEAVPLMNRLQIPVNDLYAAMLPRKAEFQIPANCHFLPAGYEFLGNATAEAILKQLNSAE